MSSRGLERARSALQGGFSPGRCFRRRRRAGPPGGETNLSLRGARAEDFLLKFKRKTGFHSAPKNVFPGGQWASFCASEGPRGGRGGDPGARPRLTGPRPPPPESGQLSEGAGAGSPASPRNAPLKRAGWTRAVRELSPGVEARTKVSCRPGCGAWGAPGRPTPGVPGFEGAAAGPEGRAPVPRQELARWPPFSPRSALCGATGRNQPVSSGRGTLSPSSPALRLSPLPGLPGSCPPPKWPSVRGSVGPPPTRSLHSRGLREKGEPGPRG